jgi:large subunit ribosomal protein L22
MPGLKTNERPGTRAVLRHYRMSATKARQVLDLVRGKDVDRAHEILRGTPREGARVVAKVLASAVANARHNDGLEPEELFVSACYADEGTTIKRWRPRARGRATRIRKRTCHITVIVSRLPEDRLARRRAEEAASTSALRSRRVAASRRGRQAEEEAAGTSEVDELETTEAEADAAEATDVEDEVAVEELEAGDDATEAADDDEAVAEGEAPGADPFSAAPEVEAEDEPAEEAPAPKARRGRRRAKAEAAADEDASGDEESD